MSRDTDDFNFNSDMLNSNPSRQIKNPRALRKSSTRETEGFDLTAPRRLSCKIATLCMSLDKNDSNSSE